CDIEPYIPSTRLRDFLAERTVTKSDFQYRRSAHAAHGDAAQQIRVELEVGFVETANRLRRMIGYTDFLSESRTAKLVPELRIGPVNAGGFGHSRCRYMACFCIVSRMIAVWHWVHSTVRINPSSSAMAARKPISRCALTVLP